MDGWFLEGWFLDWWFLRGWLPVPELIGGDVLFCESLEADVTITESLVQGVDL